MHLHRQSLADTQHDAAMFMAYLAGLIGSGPAPDLGSAPGSGALAVTSTYSPAENTALTGAATVFGSDPPTLQHVGVALLAYLLTTSG